MSNEDITKTSSADKFQDLNYEEFKLLAKDDTLTAYEKIGFPNEYRSGFEEIIFSDICYKIKNLGESKKTVIDIGPGCSELPRMLIELCREHEHTLILIDSDEMLSLLPDEPFIKKIVGFYPNDCQSLFEEYANKVDVILNYSVLHYLYLEADFFGFIDKSMSLLANQGEMLMGDIPNISKRKRFFSSPAGIRYHQKFTQTETEPTVHFNQIETGKIDDAVIFSILMRCRNAGYDAYVLPQDKGLSMENRREDILIRKP